MSTVADLHLHSKYSRAVSKDMTAQVMSQWAKRKGIDLLSAADFTHPFWFTELKQTLKDLGNGFFRHKDDTSSKPSQFLLSTEVSCIYTHNGKTRRTHLLLFAPSLEAAEKITRELTKRGANLLADGRPILGLSAHNVTEMMLHSDPLSFVIPAHIWTPWFSVYGSESGYDSLAECFSDLLQYIPAVETGLSSDPQMNWRVQELDNKAIVSFSDAHSPSKLGREVTILNDIDSYEDLLQALRAQRIEKTIEFFPEEGKYHYTGHRNCNIKQTPQETKVSGETCPVCGKRLTVGVMHRVEALANRPETYKAKRPPYVKLVPLLEILAEVHGVGVDSKRVKEEYIRVTNTLGSEFEILLKASITDISKRGSERLAEAVDRVRTGNIVIDPGYDGVFGHVSIWSESESSKPSDQMALF